MLCACHMTSLDKAVGFLCTVDREIFMLKIIGVKNFRVNKFSLFRSICEFFFYG